MTKPIDRRRTEARSFDSVAGRQPSASLGPAIRQSAVCTAVVNISLALERQSKLSGISVLDIVPVLCCHRYTRLDARTQLYSFGQIVSVRLQTVYTNFRTINSFSAIKVFIEQHN